MTIDNRSTLLPHQDVGIKVASAGFDATTALDKDLLFNSSWASMQIVMVRSVAGGGSFAHGLPYPPFAIVIPDNLSATVLYSMQAATVSNTTVYNPDSTNSCKIIVYNLNITKDIEYPYSNDKPGYRYNYDADYGIKIVKDNKDINSTDMRDYLLHSRCVSPLVLAVKTQATIPPENIDVPSGQKTIQYTSKMGYQTFNFGFIGKTDGTWQGSPLRGQSYPTTQTDGFKTSLLLLAPSPGFVTGEGSVVVLRSPMANITNSVSVNY